MTNRMNYSCCLFATLVAFSLFVSGCAPSSMTTSMVGEASDDGAAGDPTPDYAAPEGMVWVPGGWFWMGSDDGPQDERPMHRVRVNGFWMDKYELSNAEFTRFVAATGYVTNAERAVDPKEYPDSPPEARAAGSFVFAKSAVQPTQENPAPWWRFVRGANWRAPEGPGSDIDGKASHPVVHISWHDAQAYCKWAKKRLPTEAEFEFAARGGLDRKRFCWGDELRPGGRIMANTWQGEFPKENTHEDGFMTTAPVGSFPANAFSLHDLSGNVWEWCSDWYQPNYYSVSPKLNPKGPDFSGGSALIAVPTKVRRGGSFLCAENYCRRYLPSARDSSAPIDSACHTGFRCVKDR
jgi:formylglycine-generating enzyme